MGNPLCIHSDFLIKICSFLISPEFVCVLPFSGDKPTQLFKMKLLVKVKCPMVNFSYSAMCDFLSLELDSSTELSVQTSTSPRLSDFHSSKIKLELFSVDSCFKCTLQKSSLWEESSWETHEVWKSPLSCSLIVCLALKIKNGFS